MFKVNLYKNQQFDTLDIGECRRFLDYLSTEDGRRDYPLSSVKKEAYAFPADGNHLVQYGAPRMVPILMNDVRAGQIPTIPEFMRSVEVQYRVQAINTVFTKANHPFTVEQRVELTKWRAAGALNSKLKELGTCVKIAESLDSGLDIIWTEKNDMRGIDIEIVTRCGRRVSTLGLSSGSGAKPTSLARALKKGLDAMLIHSPTNFEKNKGGLDVYPRVDTPVLLLKSDERVTLSEYVNRLNWSI